ncbi:hypothetical protein C8R46DRAFT_1125414 [Mycena filopes]|nr:hypothetical protein C8R46DRAFT_1125414 [Mycena filopes]
MTSSPAHGIMDKTIVDISYTRASCAHGDQERRQTEEAYPRYELDNLCASAIVGRVRMPTTATDTIWFPETTRVPTTRTTGLSNGHRWTRMWRDNVTVLVSCSDIHRRPESACVLGDEYATARTHTSGASCRRFGRRWKRPKERAERHATIQTEDQGGGRVCRVWVQGNCMARAEGGGSAPIPDSTADEQRDRGGAKPGVDAAMHLRAAGNTQSHSSVPTTGRSSELHRLVRLVAA